MVPGNTSGFFKTFQLTKSAAASTLSLVPGLSATETNQLTLTNLDDQPSMNGLLTPVTVTQLNNYLRQGFNGEEMALLTMSRFDISKALLRALPDVASEVCAIEYLNIDIGPNKIDPVTFNVDPSSSFAQNAPYCEYLFGGQALVVTAFDGSENGIVYPRPGGPLAKFVAESRSKDGHFYILDSGNLPGRIDSSCFAGGTISRANPKTVIHSYEEQKSKAEKADADEAVDDSPPDEVVSLFNDPAVEPRGPVTDSSGNPVLDDSGKQIWGPSLNSQTCFAELVTVLMALNMHPIDGSPTALYRAPIDMVKNNDRYLADLSQQKLKVAFLYDDTSIDRTEIEPTAPNKGPAKDSKGSAKESSNDPIVPSNLSAKNSGASDKAPAKEANDSGGAATKYKFKYPSHIGVCKSADDMAIAFEGDGYAEARIGLGDSSPVTDPAPPGVSASRTGSGPDGDRKPSKVPSQPTGPTVSAEPQKAPLRSISFLPLQIANAIRLKPDNDSEESGDACQQAVEDWENNADSGGLTFKYAPRSLEGMVYYLGQVLRRRYDGLLGGPGQFTAISFVNWGYDPALGSYIYPEVLFDAERGRAPGETIAEAADESGAFYVPGLCDSSTHLPRAINNTNEAKCSIEFPNHASAQVFTMLNQLWGLNKTQATTPAIPTVDVISH
jgi:hypothetical protein